VISVPVTKKDFELEITDIAYGGRGVGRYDGKVIFVPHVLPGEIVKVKTVKERPSFSNAEIISILQSSPERVESNCLVAVGPDVMGKECFAKTPGCVYQNFSYQEEIRVKNLQFQDFLADFSKCSAPTPSPQFIHYRNKIILHTMDDHGDISLGYCEEKGVEILDMPACPLAVTDINDTLCEIRSRQGFKSTIREGMTVTLRFTENDGVTWWRNNPPANSSWLKEKTVVGSVSVPLGKFFQVNIPVADILLTKVIEIIKIFSPESVFDLYCGCGLFSIAAAKAGVDKISGLDSDKDSINAAVYNAKEHGITDALFSANSANNGLSDMLEEHSKMCNTTLNESLLIVDPPRGGLGKKVRAILKNSDFMGIIYISCAPDTLQRDLHTLQTAGYHVTSAEMLDMFPRTSHFESLITLERG